MGTNLDEVDQEEVEVEDTTPLQKRELPKGPRVRRPWTNIEDDVLRFGWGYTPLPKLAEKLGRSLGALRERSRVLQLPPPSRSTLSLRGLSERLGYSTTTVRHALTHLGVYIHRTEPLEPKQLRRSPSTRRRGTSKFALTEEDAERVAAYLSSTEDGARYTPGGKRSNKGDWSVGKKPSACLFCGTSSAPHYSKGHCKPCYMRRLFQRMQEEVETALCRWQDDGGRRQ